MWTYEAIRGFQNVWLPSRFAQMDFRSLKPWSA
jgi:hypothetical protein